MDYECNIILHILHRSNFVWILTYMWEEEPNGSFMDTWLDSPYIYDIYDNNDWDSMKIMKQVRYEGWNNNILTYQDWINHLRGWILELEKAKRLLLKFGRRGKVKRGYMAQHENPHQFDLDLVYGWIWNLGILITFIKYRDHPWE